MSVGAIGCARCATANDPLDRYCVRCGLTLGVPQADASAVFEALGPYEAPDLGEAGSEAPARDFVARVPLEAVPFGHGWRVVVTLERDRRQAVYIGHGGTDPEGRALLALVSVCGPVGERDLRTLLKLNATMTEGRFAIKVLRGEEYCVVVHTCAADDRGTGPDPGRLIHRIARLADGLEERLSRGRDLY